MRRNVAALAVLLRLPRVFWRAVAAYGAQPTGLAHPWLCGYVAAIAAYGIRLGIAAAIGLMLIGGCLVLSFTTTTWCQTIRVE